MAVDHETMLYHDAHSRDAGRAATLV